MKNITRVQTYWLQNIVMKLTLQVAVPSESVGIFASADKQVPTVVLELQGSADLDVFKCLNEIKMEYLILLDG